MMDNRCSKKWILLLCIFSFFFTWRLFTLYGDHPTPDAPAARLQDEHANAKLERAITTLQNEVRNQSIEIKALKSESAARLDENAKAVAVHERNITTLRNEVTNLKNEVEKNGVETKLERVHKEWNASDYVNSHLRKFGGPFCVGDKKIIVSVINDDHEVALRCQLEPKCNTNYSFPTGAFSNAAIIPKALKEGIFFWREDISEYHIFGENNVAPLDEDSPRPPFGNRSGALLLDNHVGAYQFGHTMNLLVPLIVLLEAGIKEFDDVTVLRLTFFTQRIRVGSRR